MTYPNSLDSFTTKTDGLDDVKAADINSIQNAIEAVETELGMLPKGTYPTVKDRLDTIPQKASSAEITAGTDDAKFTTPKGLKDSGIGSTAKASAAEIITGTEDAKFTTPKGLKDAGIVPGGMSSYPCNGRLTLESGVPVSVTDQTAKATLYFTPHLGDMIALYDGSAWSIKTFTELSLSLSGYTASLPYDIFIYNNAGTLTLESAAWTNSTTRATALVKQNGVLVKSGAATRRYLGTICITSTTGQCEDSIVNRLVWNKYNQVTRHLAVAEGTSHTYGTDTMRKWNNSDTNNLLQIITGEVSLLTLSDQAKIKAGAAGNYAAIQAFVNGNSVGVNVANLSTLELALVNQGDTYSRIGMNSIQGYEGGNSAASTFVLQLLSCKVAM